MNRRQFTQRSAQVAALTFFPVNIISKMSQADEIIGHRDYQYRVHKDWGQQDPSLVPVNNCHEMVQDRQGRLLMIGDDIRNNILIYNTDGKIIDTWGSEYPFGHGLTLWDEGGEDVLFICDNGFDGNPQVVKTTLTGDVIMRLNHPHELGIYDQSDPYHPTETAVAPNGDIYVADGYGSQWILQFNYRGEYIRKFGGQGDADHQFQTAHGVCVDLRNPDIPSLVCTSRGHNAFKKFTLDGEYLSTIFLPGAYVCRAVIPRIFMSTVTYPKFYDPAHFFEIYLKAVKFFDYSFQDLSMSSYLLLEKALFCRDSYRIDIPLPCDEFSCFPTSLNDLKRGGLEAWQLLPF